MPPASLGRILTVTPNPALDITYSLNRLELGEGHRVRPLVRAGGKGVNVARVAHQLGHAVLAVAPAGGDNGAHFRAELGGSGVPHQLVDSSVQTRRSIALVETVEDRTTILNEHGDPLAPEDWRRLIAAISSLIDGSSTTEAPPVAVVVGSGSLPDQAPGDFYPQLVRGAHGRGLPAIIDTSGHALVDSARAGADLLKPNRQELAEAVGVADPVTGARRLLELGARRVLVSLGADGMAVFSRDQADTHLRARLPRPLCGNPTGAGDAAVAAAAVALAAGSPDLETILRTATAWSAAAVLAPQAGSVATEQLELEKQLIVTKEIEV